MNLPLMDDMDKILNNKPALRRLQPSTSSTTQRADSSSAAVVVPAGTTTSGHGHGEESATSV